MRTRRVKVTEPHPSRPPRWWRKWLWRIAVAATIIVPLVIDPRGFDAFRSPKEIAFNAAAIALLAILAIAAVLGELQRNDAPPFSFYYLVLLCWIAVTDATATQHTLALHATLSILGSIALFAVVSSESNRKLSAVFVLFIPATLNGALYVLQELRIWNPIINPQEFMARMNAIGRDWSTDIHSASTALLGNPTDVAGYLLPTVIALAALGFADAKRRPIFFTAAVVFAALVVSTRILTAVIAMIGALLVMATLISKKAIVATVVVVMVSGALFLTLYAPLRMKIRDSMSDLKSHNYGNVLSSRLPAFLAAWEMIVSHKLVGVGPGCFKYQYFDYKLEAEKSHAWMLDSEARALNFGEAHNDHLQVAAEIGLPGYLIFVTGLVLLGLGSFRRRDQEPSADDRVEFSRLCSLPLAVALALFGAAQFPLELPAVLIGFLYLGGLTVAWRVAA